MAQEFDLVYQQFGEKRGEEVFNSQNVNTAHREQPLKQQSKSQMFTLGFFSSQPP